MPEEINLPLRMFIMHQAGAMNPNTMLQTCKYCSIVLSSDIDGPFQENQLVFIAKDGMPSITKTKLDPYDPVEPCYP